MKDNETYKAKEKIQTPRDYEYANTPFFSDTCRENVQGVISEPAT